jgi:hypothetical protein
MSEEVIPDLIAKPEDVSEGTMGVDFNKLLMLERWGGKRFQIQGFTTPDGRPVFCHMLKYLDSEEADEYITIYANGMRDDDFFVKVPILRPFEGVMMFGDMAVEKNEKGWRILK